MPATNREDIMNRQPPLNMGDVFVVDNGDLGITVKNKGKHSFDEILDMWPEEQGKDWAYIDFETSMVFNNKGRITLTRWLVAAGKLVPHVVFD